MTNREPSGEQVLTLSVCIATVRPETLGDAIRAIRAQTWTQWELLVVGQGDETTLREATLVASGGDSRVRFVYLGSRGLSRARNVAVAQARGQIVAFTDDDCEPDPLWLATLARCFSGDPTLGVVAGAVLAPPPSRPGPTLCPSWQPLYGRYDPVASGGRPPPTWNWIGANVAMRREVLARNGEFDNLLGSGSLFPAAEDTDYKLRLEAAGVRMLVTPEAIVLHTHGRRYGLHSVLQSSRAYARGNGALAAKLTLQGDPRGRQWLRATQRDCLLKWLHQRRPQRLAADLLRLYHYQWAYVHCTRSYRADAATGTLRARTTPWDTPLGTS